MNPYRNLLSNTVLFGISTFGSRFVTFLLTPFYTRVLSSTEYGVTDLLIQSGNLIIPIASAGIANAVIRYGLERTGNQKGIFTIGLLTTLAGFCLLLLAAPLLGRIAFLSDSVWLVLLYVLSANVHSVCNQFARTLGHVRLFALDGVLRTVLTVFFISCCWQYSPWASPAMCWQTCWPTGSPPPLYSCAPESGNICLCPLQAAGTQPACCGTASLWSRPICAAGSSIFPTAI